MIRRGELTDEAWARVGPLSLLVTAGQRNEAPELGDLLDEPVLGARADRASAPAACSPTGATPTRTAAAC